MAEHKNILVQYKGGGYDGCFWQWNYFFFDAEGNWHDLFSSGRKGRDTREKAEALLDEMPNGTYVYDLTDDDAIDKFQDECNAGHVVEVTGKINRLTKKQTMWFRCDECGEKVYSGTADDESGAGGVEIQYNTKLCEACACERVCRNETEDDDE